MKAGRYTLTVRDETRSGGFSLQKLGAKPSTLTGTSYVGRRSVTLTLKAGQWVFFALPARKGYFVVTA